MRIDSGKLKIGKLYKTYNDAIVMPISYSLMGHTMLILYHPCRAHNGRINAYWPNPTDRMFYIEMPQQ